MVVLQEEREALLAVPNPFQVGMVVLQEEQEAPRLRHHHLPLHSINRGGHPDHHLRRRINHPTSVVPVELQEEQAVHPSLEASEVRLVNPCQAALEA